MRTTIFNTPLVTWLMRSILVPSVVARGWKTPPPLPDVKKCVLVVAPHTSNWDFPIGMAYALWYRLQARWVGKDSLFKFPVGGAFKWMGGIPVDRSQRHNFVHQAAALFEQHETLWMAVTPEGTRSKVDKWKTGFYYIALEAKVPIVLAYIDYGRKEAGIDRVIYPTGDLETELDDILAYYANITGNRPEQWGQGNDEGSAQN